MSTPDKHIFAVYYPEIDTIKDVATCDITARDVMKRLRNVLRLSVGEEVVLFGDQYVATCRLRAIEKRRLVCNVCERRPIQPMQPRLYWYIPVAEKAAFEDAVAYATVMGVYAVYPYISHKSKDTWGSPKDFDRIHRVTIAAAEQAKQYARPTVHHPVALHEIPLPAQHAFVCDPAGDTIRTYLSRFTQAKSTTSFAGLVGPQAGLTDDEIAYLASVGFHRVCLGPSIMRMETAVSVAAGMMRALLMDAHTSDSA